MKPVLLIPGLLILMFITAEAQQGKKIKFGDINSADFATKIYSVDSNASAVVLSDIGSTRIEGNNEGWFSLNYKRYTRIHILNKNGFDAASFSIPLFSSGGGEEELDKLKAVTYNLENGKVVETKLDIKSGVFKDKIINNFVVKKFTLPNVKEGSIIEVEYSIYSDFLSNLQPWEFQGQHPRLWSEYNVTIPEFLGYLILSQGYQPFFINEKKSNEMPFRVNFRNYTAPVEKLDFNAKIVDHKWVMKDVPALKEETFTSTLKNHIAKIEFQLTEYRYPLKYTSLLGTWENLSKKMLEAEYFGEQLGKENGWLKEQVKPLIENVPGDLEKAKKIYVFVRDNFNCTDNSAVSMYQNLRNVLKSKTGSVAEINLLLTAMMKWAGINAEPVILSTRSNGFALSLYPLPAKFNYVISQLTMDGKNYYLDASQPRLGFGYLPLHCYNGHARVINTTCDPLELNADYVVEQKNTTVFVVNDEKGNLVGSVQTSPGYYESLSMRNKIREKGQEELVKEFRKDFGLTIDISKPQFDSLEKFENPLAISYDFDIKEEKQDIMYINPMFGEGYKENPFKSARRLYPVEMPYAMDYTYNLHFEVPPGYQVDELPQQMVVKLNENEDGIFEYRISESNGTISLRSRVALNRANFPSEEYDTLREFFNMVVTKQNEQIVLKKKK